MCTFAFYFIISVMTFIVYLVDKTAAQKNRWRIPEKTLHLLSLVGGWPGALLAQRLLRHKTQKISFQLVHLVTVGSNLTGLFFLVSNSELNKLLF